MPRSRSTAADSHRPVLLSEILGVVAPQSGECAVDCTLGFAGHALPLLERLGPSGLLLALDADGHHLASAGSVLGQTGLPHRLRHANFAGLAGILAEERISGADIVVADLGMSSMQLDDPNRGFSYVRDGPLDMRLDRSHGRTAADVLATISEEHLALGLREYADESHAECIARALVAARQERPLLRTSDVVGVVGEALHQATQRGAGWRLHPSRNTWNPHPAARTFQALRILVNRELANLQELLRMLPDVLRPGGRAAVISFHSGEDRLVKQAFREGNRRGVYVQISKSPVRAAGSERQANPRSRSAKLRWAIRAP